MRSEGVALGVRSEGLTITGQAGDGQTEVSWRIVSGASRDSASRDATSRRDATSFGAASRDATSRLYTPGLDRSDAAGRPISTSIGYRSAGLSPADWSRPEDSASFPAKRSVQLLSVRLLPHRCLPAERRRLR